MTNNIVIVGSGPAGLTAAIYAARAKLNPILITGYQIGGQLTWTTLVENYPGFPNGIMGPELMENMRKQAENHGTQFIYEQVTSIDLSDEKNYTIKTDTQEIQTTSIIIATGSSPRKLNILGEEQFFGKGISSCATCDGAFFKDKTIAVVGGGDSAMEESTYLTKFAKKIYLIHRRNEFSASKTMQEKVFKNEKIEIVWNTTITEVKGTQTVTALTLQNTDTKETTDLPIEGLFLAIGHIPNTQWLNNQLELDHMGYIKAENHTKTSKPGIFVAGDVQDYHYQQAITAAGLGCMAALDAEEWLRNNT